MGAPFLGEGEAAKVRLMRKGSCMRRRFIFASWGEGEGWVGE